jgi:hypothetical protein
MTERERLKKQETREDESQSETTITSTSKEYFLGCTEATG